jgi:alpha-galactosidase/6-phospho-beta-glucosidase family protein
VPALITKLVFLETEVFRKRLPRYLRIIGSCHERQKGLNRALHLLQLRRSSFEVA